MRDPSIMDNNRHHMSRAITWLWLSLLMAIGLYLRVRGTADYHYSPDDMMHLDMARAPNLGEALAYGHYETHPPLANILRYYWLMISTQPAYVRSMSLVFGLILIPLYYRIGESLEGQLTGFIAATLITFSTAAVTQSFVVRNYTLLLCLLCLALYYHLQWRKQHAPRQLLCYGVTAILACETHFSALMLIFCVASYESIALCVMKASWRRQLHWAGMNGLIAIVALWTYYHWLPSMHMLGDNIDRAVIDYNQNTFFITSTLIIGYFLPLTRAASQSPILCLSILLALPYAIYACKPIRPYGIICILGLAINYLFAAISNQATMLTGRHAIWLLPPLLMTAAGLATGPCRSFFYQRRLQHIFLFVLLVATAVMHDATVPTSDWLEFPLPEKAYGEATEFLHSLDEHSIIITGRQDIFVIAPEATDLYGIMDSHHVGLDPAHMVESLPYHHSHIIFNPYYYRLILPGTLESMLHEAAQRHMLDGVDSFVLVNTRWTSPLVFNLMQCPLITKTIRPFSAEPTDVSSADALKQVPISLLIISRKEFERALTDPQIESGCLHPPHTIAGN